MAREHEVTVRGTHTPCAGVLATGEVRTVAVTDHLRRLVKNGCIEVIEGSLRAPVGDVDEPRREHQEPPEEPQISSVDEPAFDAGGVVQSAGRVVAFTTPERILPVSGPAPAVEAPVVVKAPKRNASRAVWAEFLDNHEPDPIPYPADADRDDLIALYDRWSVGEQEPEPPADGDG